jgi:hypothetical protein
MDDGLNALWIKLFFFSKDLLRRCSPHRALRRPGGSLMNI